MAVSVQEEILGFEISIYNILCMEVFEGKCDLGGIELCYRIGKPLASRSASARSGRPTISITHLRLPEETEEFSALNKIHHHVKVFRVLEGAPKRDQKWMFDPLEHFALVVCVLNLLHLDHLLFLQDLDSIVTLVVL